MEAYQQRLIDEREQLNDKVVKLNAFINSDLWSKVPPAEQKRLDAQLGYMRQYLWTLDDRIAAFKES